MRFAFNYGVETTSDETGQRSHVAEQNDVFRQRDRMQIDNVSGSDASTGDA